MKGGDVGWEDKATERRGKNRHSCSSSLGDVRWEFVCQHGKGEFQAEMSKRVRLTSSDFDWRLVLRTEDSEEENAKHPPPLEKSTGLLQRLAIKVLPHSRSVCFACAECTTSPKVQHSSLKDAQEKKKPLTFSRVTITVMQTNICPWWQFQRCFKLYNVSKSVLQIPSSVAIWAVKSLVYEPLWTLELTESSKPLS